MVIQHNVFNMFGDGGGYPHPIPFHPQNKQTRLSPRGHSIMASLLTTILRHTVRATGGLTLRMHMHYNMCGFLPLFLGFGGAGVESIDLHLLSRWTFYIYF